MTVNLKNTGMHAEEPHVISLKHPAPREPVRHAAPTAPVHPVRHPRAKQERSVFLIAVIAVALFALIAISVAVSKSQFFASDDPEKLAARVGELILLPENEVPTVATVSDMHALEGQAFFQNAQLGDKVLMYLAAQKAVLYRPSEDLIIEVGPITGSEQ